MTFDNILVDQQDKIALITINRPTKLNALNRDTIQELHLAFSHLEKDPSTRVVLLTGSGEKAFVAGADIAEFAHFDENAAAKLARKGQETLFHFIENFPKPVIAVINGFALGGGLELAMAAHVRIAAQSAKMGLPEVSLGVIPGYGGTQRLARLTGKGKAMEMILSAGMIAADEACKWGLVNQVVSQEDLLSVSKKMAGKMARNASPALAAAIKAVNAGYRHDVDGYEVEIAAFAHCFSTPDFKEGTQAFLEKRPPKFQ
ncbi:MAG: enoyl-CoA hydratase-related protein [Lutibacter sp.]|jgi:enoyl-CoA hydratase|nr:enoyl-CoA hydratase-related protein [Lutibacter sp.]